MKVALFILACLVIYGGSSLAKREPFPEPCTPSPIVCVFDGSSEVCYPIDPEPPCFE